MTIVSNTNPLTPKDYPEFEQTVGNSFASSFPDSVEKEETHLKRLENVSQGLFQIYEHVVADAAKGAPMTPHDSAVISTTVANMTSSVGVESHVGRIASLESHYDQHIGFMVTQESIGKTIMNTMRAFFEAFMRFLEKIIGWFKKAYNAAQDRSRPLLRALNTLRRVTNAGIVSVKYTPSMEGILVDGQIPAEWMGKVIDTLRVSYNMMEGQSKMADYANDLMFAVEKVNFQSPDAALGEVEKILARRPKLSLGSARSRTEKVDGKTIEWSEPLCGNSLAIAMNPEGDEAIDNVNYGIGLVHLSVAEEFGVKTKFNDKNNDDTLVTIDLGDAMRHEKALIGEINNSRVFIGRMDKQINDLQGSLKKITEKFRDFERNNDSDTTTESIEKLLTFSGVARSVSSAAVACSRYNFDVYGSVVEGATAVFNAFAKKFGGK